MRCDQGPVDIVFTVNPFILYKYSYLLEHALLLLSFLHRGLCKEYSPGEHISFIQSKWKKIQKSNLKDIYDKQKGIF